MVLKKGGFTLVELLIVMGILAVLMVIMVGILNPQSLTARANDSRRKKDLARIKVAFEEYANDHDGCYPIKGVNGPANTFDFDNMTCNSNEFAPWLNQWPCDPLNNKYLVFTEPSSCPRWYKVTTKLEYLHDNVIPAGWSYDPNLILGDVITAANSNYGVSSSAIVWSQLYYDDRCQYYPINGVGSDIGHVSDECFSITENDNCAPSTVVDPKHPNIFLKGCKGSNCYAGNIGIFPGEYCASACKVTCCGYGCDDGANGMFE